MKDQDIIEQLKTINAELEEKYRTLDLTTESFKFNLNESFKTNEKQQRTIEDLINANVKLSLSIERLVK
ncbi:hypothetical protein N9924_00985 [bacterium]|nr:hypothetical protein [bacterium]